MSEIYSLTPTSGTSPINLSKQGTKLYVPSGDEPAQVYAWNGTSAPLVYPTGQVATDTEVYSGEMNTGSSGVNNRFFKWYEGAWYIDQGNRAPEDYLGKTVYGGTQGFDFMIYRSQSSIQSSTAYWPIQGCMSLNWDGTTVGSSYEIEEMEYYFGSSWNYRRNNISRITWQPTYDDTGLPLPDLQIFNCYLASPTSYATGTRPMWRANTSSPTRYAGDPPGWYPWEMNNDNVNPGRMTLEYFGPRVQIGSMTATYTGATTSAFYGDNSINWNIPSSEAGLSFRPVPYQGYTSSQDVDYLRVYRPVAVYGETPGDWIKGRGRSHVTIKRLSYPGSDHEQAFVYHQTTDPDDPDYYRLLPARDSLAFGDSGDGSFVDPATHPYNGLIRIGEELEFNFYIDTL